MKLIAIYKPHQAINRVYCPACFTILKLNNRFEGYNSVETNPVPGMDFCGYCGDNQGPTKQQITYLIQEAEQIRKKLESKNKE